MLLVYTHKITPRVTYIFKHIFTRILQIPIDFTTKIEEFIAHDGLKISYSKKPLGNELFVRSIDLLFNQGIDYPDINITKWEDTPCFFQVNSSSPIPFDVFAASFFLLSRYEEYLPHVKDEFERWKKECRNSLEVLIDNEAVQNGVVKGSRYHSKRRAGRTLGGIYSKSNIFNDMCPNTISAENIIGFKRGMMILLIIWK